MSDMTPQEKVRTCLNYIDNRLETTSQQTIQIAEMMMEDIREFNDSYLDAVKNNNLAEYTDQVRNTQLKWMNQLQDIIVEQTSRDLSGQVILALQSFTDKLEGAKLKNVDFELPSAVASKQADALDYMSQEDIDALMNQDT
ncbi:hypothetical protein [Thiomicrospira pelophila]|uniref:hypothetical protein n=1 Tax=Thiomicrospira pelophila TaxID=934 RepID=UPI0004A6C36E|nr:hypothetical protein [Thiomicrospira pelophila]